MALSPLNTIITDDATLSRAHRLLGVSGRRNVNSGDGEAPIAIALRSTDENGDTEQRTIKLFKIPNFLHQEKHGRNPFEHDVIFVALEMKVTKDSADMLTNIYLEFSTLDTRDSVKMQTGVAGRNFAHTIGPPRFIRANPGRDGRLGDCRETLFRQEVQQLLEQPLRNDHEIFNTQNSNRNIVIVCHDLPQLQTNLHDTGIDLNYQSKVIEVIDVERLAHISNFRAIWASLVTRKKQGLSCSITTYSTKLPLYDIAWLTNTHERRPYSYNPFIVGNSGAVLRLLVRLACTPPPFGSDGGEFYEPCQRSKTEKHEVNGVTLRQLSVATASTITQIAQKIRDGFSDQSIGEANRVDEANMCALGNKPDWMKPTTRYSVLSSSAFVSEGATPFDNDHNPLSFCEGIVSSSILGTYGAYEQKDYPIPCCCISEPTSPTKTKDLIRTKDWEEVDGMWQVRMVYGKQRIVLPGDVYAHLRMYERISPLFNRCLYEAADRYGDAEDHATKRREPRTHGVDDNDYDSCGETYYETTYFIKKSGYIPLAHIVGRNCPQKSDGRMMLALQVQIEGREVVDKWYEENFPIQNEESVRHRDFTAKLKEVRRIIQNVA